MSIYEGNSLRNSDSFLDVIFDKEQSYDVFRDYYGYVRDLCSFLTFRDNVTFEKIYNVILHLSFLFVAVYYLTIIIYYL